VCNGGDERTIRDCEPICCPMSAFLRHDFFSEFDVPQAITKTSGEAATGGLARLQGYRGRVGVLGRPAREPTARPTLGRIGPGLPDAARWECEMIALWRASPWGTRLPEAPVPPRSQSGLGSVALTRWESVVS
jgi:hypothetical protein